MTDFLVVVAIIALIAVTILCIYLITISSRVRRILAIVEKDIQEISAKAIPILNNLEIITDKVRNVTENIDEQVEAVKSSLHAIKEIADNIVSFERKIQDQIEDPVMETIGTFAAVIKGIRTFFTRIRV